MSEATIRRDLTVLARQGKLNKVHGGAVLIGVEFHSEELDMETKRQLCIEEKKRIARHAASLIEDEDVVYLDSGSTVLLMAADQAGDAYVLADASKFGTITAAEMFPLEEAHVITDHLPDQRYRDYTSVEEV